MYPTAVSDITVQSKPSLANSKAVSLDPCRAGRVSGTITLTYFPASLAALTTPRAVPYPTVASAPALHWVKTVSPSSISSAPISPSLLFTSTSSSAILLTSPTTASVIPPTPPECLRALFITRSTPQKRLTAVGLVDFSPAAALSISLSSSPLVFALEWTAASATPIAAATPMAGAPLATIPPVASVTSSPPRKDR